MQPLSLHRFRVNHLQKLKLQIRKGLIFFHIPGPGFYTIESSFTGYTTQVKDSVLIDEQHTAIAPVLHGCRS